MTAPKLRKDAGEDADLPPIAPISASDQTKVLAEAHGSEVDGGVIGADASRLPTGEELRLLRIGQDNLAVPPFRTHWNDMADAQHHKDDRPRGQ